MGGNVRKGERGTTVCYADRFTPKEGDNAPTGLDGEPRQIAFLKRFTVFNTDHCEGLGDQSMTAVTTWNEALTLPVAQALIEATGADIRIGGGEAYYAPQDDYIRVPRPEHFHQPINWFRTVFHELGHLSGHRSRLDRLPDTGFGSPAYAREELIAELASAFLCAELGIVPTVRHADYLGAWLAVLREDSKAIFRAASQASKAADYLLAFVQEKDRGEAEA
ncbi:protein of unknown function [Sphingobium sp. YR768]|nr:protein of unknown function [Sphingobium sp. YR768]